MQDARLPALSREPPARPCAANRVGAGAAAGSGAWEEDAPDRARAPRGLGTSALVVTGACAHSHSRTHTRALPGRRAASSQPLLPRTRRSARGPARWVPRSATWARPSRARLPGRAPLDAPVRGREPPLLPAAPRLDPRPPRARRSGDTHLVADRELRLQILAPRGSLRDPHKSADGKGEEGRGEHRR